MKIQSALINAVVCIAIVSIASVSVRSTAEENDCPNLEPDTDAYREALKAMSGHFPVPLESIQYCGMKGYAGLFAASVPIYESGAGWSRSGSLRCWKFSEFEEGHPYRCGRRIINTHSQSGTNLATVHPIPLNTLDEIVAALQDRLASIDAQAKIDRETPDSAGTARITGIARIEWIEYAVVTCGGAWSIGENGFKVQIRPRSGDAWRAHIVKKDCSPTPCQWTIEELELPDGFYSGS